jgi:hypothetical protein
MVIRREVWTRILDADLHYFDYRAELAKTSKGGDAMQT